MSTSINPSDLCSHLRNKLFDADGCYRNGKKILVLAGKTSPKIIREDVLCKLISQPTNQ